MLLTVLAFSGPVAADAVDDLTTTLATHKNDKARVAAAVALHRQGGKRALKPLVDALTDRSASVRLVAVAALGQMQHKAALPALQRQAANDLDVRVRTAANKSVAQIRLANGLLDHAEQLEKPTVVALAQPAVARAGASIAPSAAPNVWVSIGSVSDSSKVPAATRKSHAAYAKTLLQQELLAAQVPISAPRDGERARLQRQIDVSVVRMDHRVRGASCEVEAEVRVSIADETGNMLVVLTRGAMVQYPKSSMVPANLTQWRREALDAATRNAVKSLLKQLARGPEA